MLIAPLVIPSRSPKPSSLPTATSTEKQSLLTCYAGLFARLPSLGQIMNSQFAHAQELYNHLFAPSTPVPDPAQPNPAFHQSTPPRDSTIPVSNPFSDLVVDLPSSLDDTHNMSRPTAPPLTLSTPSALQPAPIFNFTPLLQFLADTINPHITLLASQPTHSCLVVLVVGPSTHPMAGPSLHSHLVTSFTALPGDDLSVVYIPTDLIQGFPEHIDWHPLLVYTTVSLAYPDLPFLVVSPEYSAGATTSPASLRTLLSPTDSMVVFSCSESIIVPDVFLHLPPRVPLQNDEAMPDASSSAPPPATFRIRTAEEIQSLITATTTLHFSSHADRRADLTDPIQLDLHFPLFCTPYYGFVPEDMTDLHIELLHLARHLIRSTPPLLDVWDSNTLPTPASLLATLAALYPARITTAPGEGVFLRPYFDPDGDNPPQSCWLNRAPGPTPFVPAQFHHLESTLTAHSPNSPLPMFAAAIPLGPSACVNPGLLPPPRLTPPGDLALSSTVTGGWGAIQYYYHFRPDSGAIPLLSLTTTTHTLPAHFHEDLLDFEHWPPADELLAFNDTDLPEPVPILSISCPELQTIASPDHGITFCNGPARTSRAFSHGPTLANTDWHKPTSDISGCWQGDHCHTLGVGCIAEAFYLTANLWPNLSIDTVTPEQFTTPVTSAFVSHTSQARECLHSYRPTLSSTQPSPSSSACSLVRNFCSRASALARTLPRF